MSFFTNIRKKVLNISGEKRASRLTTSRIDHTLVQIDVVDVVISDQFISSPPFSFVYRTSVH